MTNGRKKKDGPPLGMSHSEFRQKWRVLKENFPSLYREMIEYWEGVSGGPFKKVTNAVTRESFAVPVEVVITEGITADDLEKYPRWDPWTHSPYARRKAL